MELTLEILSDPSSPTASSSLSSSNPSSANGRKTDANLFQFITSFKSNLVPYYNA